jgi:hypothetical protein
MGKQRCHSYVLRWQLLKARKVRVATTARSDQLETAIGFNKRHGDKKAVAKFQLFQLRSGFFMASY